MAEKTRSRPAGALGRALRAGSPLRSRVRAGLQALERPDKARVRPQPPSFVTDSLALDASLKDEQHNAPRWDYLLGTEDEKKPIIGVEVHPATPGEVAGVLTKSNGRKEKPSGISRRAAASGHGSGSRADAAQQEHHRVSTPGPRGHRARGSIPGAASSGRGGVSLPGSPPAHSAGARRVECRCGTGCARIYSRPWRAHALPWDLVSLLVMTALKATVRDGRLVLDLPTNLPDGTEVSLVPVDGWDDLDEEDRRRLHEALLASEDDIAHGRVFTAEEVLADLRGS